MGQRVLAVIGAALALASIGPGVVGADAARDAAPPALAPAAEAVVLEGELLVNGRRVEAAIERTDRAPAEVIAAERARWAEAPVDLIERALPDGALLSILDVAGGRQVVVAARRRGGRTEVVRGASPLGPGAATPPIPLPEGWIPAASVEDRLAGRRLHTATLLAPLGAAAADRALRAQLAAAGWEARETGWRRDGARLAAAVHGDEARAIVHLRLEEDER